MAFQGGSRVDPNEQIKDVDQQIVQGIREGKAFHQSPTLENGPYRSRVLDPVNPQHEGNLFSAYNASVLHTQVQERSLGSPEFVKSAVLKELGHERKDDTRFEKQYWVAPSGSRMAAVGGGTVKTTSAPHAYLHVETQTTLPTKDFPLKGKLNEKGLVTAVETVAKLSGVKLQYAKDDRLAHKDGKAGPTVVVPTPDKFQSREAWASAALTGVASAVQRSPRLRSEVEVDAVEMAAVRSENNRRGVSNFRRREAARDQGAEPGRGQARVGPQTDLPGYLRVRGDASAAVFTEALTKLAKERGVTLDLEGRNPQASFDGKTKTFTAAGRGEFRGPARNAAWKQQALSDLAKEVGGQGMAKAVDQVRRGDRYAVVKAVGVGNFRPEQTLGTAEEKARADLVGGIAAKRLAEQIGVRYDPGETAQADRDRQAAVAEKVGYRSLCAQAEQTKNYLLDVNDRPRTPERQASISHSASSQTLDMAQTRTAAQSPAQERAQQKEQPRGR